ncbi:tetratricopeptide repeat protein [Actinokineospora inagensis]|uniref:tetratricopeptide repeat protein n=1 Tax=Actinokineospora inagensis TaxID=103730 RepID=UPI000415C8CE|nr:tetratricopeptide repeat protein [Actinokineospora inagensis]
MPGELPLRSSAVPVVVDGFQRRSVPELDGLTSGGVVLSGLGGVGKTQTAAEYANRLWSAGEVDLVGWVTATSRTSVLSGLAELTGSPTGDASLDARRFLDWCGSTTHRWLLVLDDVTDPADLDGLWPHTGTSGRLVVTTRRNEPSLRSADRRLMPLAVFTPDESTAYLTGVLGADSGIPELAELLGHLPLALSQAAAYLSMVPGLTCRDYIATWQRTLASRFPESWAGRTVATTWSISVDAADELPPMGLARPVLSVMSLLDPNGIPLSVLTSKPMLDYLSSGGGEPVDAVAAARALGNLQRLNLISVDADHIARVHALVQHATRDQLPGDGLGRLAKVAAKALTSSWPNVERDTGLVLRLLGNTHALFTVAPAELWRSNAYRVLFRAGLSLSQLGFTDTAVEYHTSLYMMAHANLGVDHPDSLVARHEIARLLGEKGDHGAAVQAMTELLDDQRRVLGPDHPATLATHYSLAYWLGIDEPTTALVELEAVLDDRVRVLGPDHRDTLTTRHELARSRGRAGDPAAAVRDLTEVLADRVRTLRPDHPHILATRHNLAHWQGKSGDVVAAVLGLAGVLEDEIRVLGLRNPRTWSTMHDLAYWLAEAGSTDIAVRAFHEVHDLRLGTLGPDHPDTKRTRGELDRLSTEDG